jgi:hypothetical protein
LVGTSKKAKCGFTHIFVIVDKFTKWIEVKLAASITTAKVVEFIKEIMYRLVCPTILSRIIGLSSLQGNLGTFVQTRASRFIMPLCHTCRVMVK